MISMKYDELRPSGSRYRQLSDFIDGINPMLDTPCDLSNPSQMVNIGRGLYIPQTTWAYRIPVEPNVLTIDFIEICYNEDQHDFVTCTLNLDATGRNRTPADITSVRLSKLAMDRIKRNVLAEWILFDHGTNRKPQRWQTWDSYLKEQPRMVSNRGGDLAMHSVAQFYAVAKFSACDARELIADQYRISRATASRWISKAKELGYIKN